MKPGSGLGTVFNLIFRQQFDHCLLSVASFNTHCEVSLWSFSNFWIDMAGLQLIVNFKQNTLICQPTHMWWILKRIISN